jgi:hypothetical protein
VKNGPAGMKQDFMFVPTVIKRWRALQTETNLSSDDRYDPDYLLSLGMLPLSVTLNRHKIGDFSHSGVVQKSCQ